jgi:hypothetical protein
MRKNGYIKLQRSFFDHKFWGKKREFSYAEAFLDLIQNANYSPKKVMVGASSIHLDRGEQVASLRYLGKRWGWSKGRVSRFICVLKTEHMAGQRIAHGQTIITLYNYETYNSPTDLFGTPDGTPSGTATGQQRDKTEEGKKERSNNSCPKSDEEAMTLWPIFPAKGRTRSSKEKVRNAYRRATKKPPIEEMVAELKKWVASDDWQEKGGQFVPAADRWIRERRWEESPEPAKTQSSGGWGNVPQRHPFAT